MFFLLTSFNVCILLALGDPSIRSTWAVSDLVYAPKSSQATFLNKCVLLSEPPIKFPFLFNPNFTIYCELQFFLKCAAQDNNSLCTNYHFHFNLCESSQAFLDFLFYQSYASVDFLFFQSYASVSSNALESEFPPFMLIYTSILACTT